ncbi:MAG: site-specific DNA-methyltransferase [Candidatus Margulisbacteria bacterium]|nr:site-specific DNA-methyltransferase [Candidatus Margulisiibacteriota bacterium]
MTKILFKAKSTVIYLGDSRGMPELKDNSIDFIITSPPYWDLKNYKSNKQIGLGQSYEQYLEEIEKVFKESSRVLKAGRYFALVIGTRISDGELVHIPADCISIFRNYSMRLKKEIIWTKPKGTQGLWQRGTTQFLKSKPYPRNANYNIQHEFILIFRKENNSIISEDKFRVNHKLSEEFIKEVAWTNWTIGVSRQKNHPAAFPVELPTRLIRLYSYPGEVVLDPFMGSGTTALAANNLDRHCIGYEISKEYCEICKENIINNGK